MRSAAQSLPDAYLVQGSPTCFEPETTLHRPHWMATSGVPQFGVGYAAASLSAHAGSYTSPFSAATDSAFMKSARIAATQVSRSGNGGSLQSHASTASQMCTAFSCGSPLVPPAPVPPEPVGVSLVPFAPDVPPALLDASVPSPLDGLQPDSHDPSETASNRRPNE